MFLCRASRSCCVWKSSSGILRALASSLLSISLWISGRKMSTLMAALRLLIACSTMLRGGRGWEAYDLYVWGGGNGRISVGWYSVRRKDYPFLGIHIFPCPYRNAQPSLHQQLDRWYCHGHMHVVKSQPCWPHTWRYAPSPFPTDTFFTDSLNFSNKH